MEWLSELRTSDDGSVAVSIRVFHAVFEKWRNVARAVNDHEQLDAISPSSPVVDQNGFFRNIFGVEFDVSCFSSVASGLVLGTDKFRRVVVTTFALALSETVDSI